MKAKKRMLTALGAFALCWALLTSLSAGSLALAAQPEETEGAYVGYLVTLLPQDPDSAALFSMTQGMAVVSEEGMVYKVGEPEEARELVYSGQVAYIEPDYQAELFGVAVEPNDPYFQGSSYQYNLKTMEVQSAWDVGLSGEGVTVAIIDSGINAGHVDAPVKIAPGRFYFWFAEEDGQYAFTDSSGVTRYYNYYSSDDVTDVDCNSHGTMCAGIVAAASNNGLMVAGIAPGVTILPIRCFCPEQVWNEETQAYDSYLGGLTSNLISGLDYARTHGANIINMSWGIQSQSTSLKAAIDRASNAGCILVASAGNGGSSTVCYPAGYDNVIGVGSTGKTGEVSYFSQRNDSVAVSAPGEYIYSLDSASSNKLLIGSGTSFSSPAVVAVAALLKERDPSMTHGDFQALLTAENCTPISTGAYKAYGGAGILNVRKLLDALGHRGTSLEVSEDGAVLRVSYHPKEGEDPENGFLVLLAAYNAKGHLLSSQATLAGTVNDYGGYSAQWEHPLEGLEDIALVRAYYLSNDSAMAAAAEPLATVLTAQEG